MCKTLARTTFFRIGHILFIIDGGNLFTSTPTVLCSQGTDTWRARYSRYEISLAKAIDLYPKYFSDYPNIVASVDQNDHSNP